MGAEIIIGVIGLVVGAASAVASNIQAREQASQAKKQARRQEELQKQQIAEQERIANLQKRRAAAEENRRARLMRARYETMGSAVGGGSVFEGSLTSADIMAEYNKSVIEEQHAAQVAQFGVARQQIGLQGDIARSQANAAIQRSWANLAGSLWDVAETGFTKLSPLLSPTPSQGFQSSMPVTDGVWRRD